MSVIFATILFTAYGSFLAYHAYLQIDALLTWEQTGHTGLLYPFLYCANAAFFVVLIVACICIIKGTCMRLEAEAKAREK